MDNMDEKWTICLRNELLTAARNGDVGEVRRLIAEHADVYYADSSGNTALHHAVESGNPEVVDLLLSEIEDVDIENYNNETPFDMSFRLGNEKVTELLETHIENQALCVLKEYLLSDAESDQNMESAFNGVNFTTVEELRKTKEKIMCCLELLKKLNDGETEGTLSYEHANTFIYFLDTFALEYLETEETNHSVKKYLSQFCSETDRQSVANLRNILFHEPRMSARKLGPNDLWKFMKCDVHEFFIRLQEYVQMVHDNFKSRKDVFLLSETLQTKCDNNVASSGKARLFSCFDVTAADDVSMGEEILDLRSFLKNELKNLLEMFHHERPITAEALFSFTVNFCPAFTFETNSYFNELCNLRTEVMHNFHKYGFAEFGNEIHSLRNRFFKYCYSQDALGVLYNVKPTSSPNNISKNLEEKLFHLVEQFETDYSLETDNFSKNLKQICGCLFYRSVFPENDEDIEELVNLYLEYMIIIDLERTYKEDVFDDRCTNNQRKKLKDSDIVDIFQKILRLQRIEKHCQGLYDEEKHKFTKELVDKYGIKSFLFDQVYRMHRESDNYSVQDEMNVVKLIRGVLKKLKGLKNNHKLSNLCVSYMCNQYAHNKTVWNLDGNKDFLRNVNSEIRQVVENIPWKQSINISAGPETSSLYLSDLVNSMVKVFHSTHRKYQMTFNLEEIFGDEDFLDYLAGKLTTNENGIMTLTMKYYRFLAFIVSRKRFDLNSRQLDARNFFQRVHRLLMMEKYLNDQDYINETENLRTDLLNMFGFDCGDFDQLLKCLRTDNGTDFENTEEMRRILSIMDKISALELDIRIVPSLWSSAAEGQEQMNMDACSNDEFLKGTIVKDLEKICEENDLTLNIQVGPERFEIKTREFLLDVLQIFSEESSIKNYLWKPVTAEILLQLNYTAPYMVTLLADVKDTKISKANMAKLINSLVTTEGGLYIKYLINLLNMNVGDVGFYEEICNIMIGKDIDVESISLIFEDSRHVKPILNILSERTEQENDEKQNKVSEIIKKIIRLLNNTAYELLDIGRCSDALDFLGEVETVANELIQRNIMTGHDLIALETRYCIAKIKNLEGRRQGDNGDEKVKLHEEALQIFEDMRGILVHQCSQSLEEVRNDINHDTILYLLVLQELAYTKHFLSRWEESYEEEKILFAELIKFVLGETATINDLNEQMLSEIEKSSKYKKILAFSAASRKYLDVLEIITTVAYYKGSLGRKELRSKNFKKALQYLKVSLKIHDKVCELRKKSLNFSNKIILSSLDQFVYVNYSVADILSRNPSIRDENPLHYYKKALYYDHYSLLKYTKIYQTLKENLGLNHRQMERSRSKIKKFLRNIAYTYNKIASTSPTERNNLCEKALEIYEVVYQTLFRWVGKAHHKTLGSLSDISYTNNLLGRYEEAKKDLEIVYNIQKETLDGNHYRFLQTTKVLKDLEYKIQKSRETSARRGWRT